MTNDKEFPQKNQADIDGVHCKTQRARILRLLLAADGGWVPSPQIADCAQQYGARVLELRRQGLIIENKVERIDGVRHSFFRLLKSSGDWYAAAHGSRPSSKPVSPVADLPLFAGVR